MERMGLLVWGLVAVAAFVSISLSVLKGGIIESIRLAMIMIPVGFIIFINLRKHWHTILFIALSVHSLTINVFPFRNLGPGFFLIAAIASVLLLDTVIHARDRKQHHDIYSLLAGYVVLVYVGRLLYDRPGVVSLGMESGGLTTAFYSVLAAISYFVTRAVFIEATLTRRQVWVVGIACLLLNIHMIVRSMEQGIFKWYQELADTPTWMSCAAVLACLAPSLQNGLGAKFYAATTGYLGLGLISAHRSRVLFLGMIMVLMGTFVKRSRRMIFALALLGVVLGVGLVSAGGGRLPPMVARALSLVVPEKYWSEYYFRTGPMGWEDAFRSELYRHAWKKIMDKPLVGNGLDVDVDEALSILTGSRDTMSREMILWGRSYHNSFLIIAVEAGLPTVLCVMTLCAVIFLRFWRFTRNLPIDDPQKAWAMMLSGFWVATMGMLLVNGGQYETFNIMATNGAMMGIMVRNRYPVTAPAPVPKPRLVERAPQEIPPMGGEVPARSSLGGPA